MPLGVVQLAANFAGGHVSNAVYIGLSSQLVAIDMPATQWDAANLTFLGSSDGVAFQDLYDALGNEITAVAVVAHSIAVDSLKIKALWLKVRSGTGGAPVDQSHAPTLTLTIQKFANV